ncbi:MAG: hypothetical protein B7733_08835 [Myxococcales bacterium FL481]|nr:MAG: hypothetical protein B7733_08835 [Myxococcales bacterium FL481]
MPFDDPPAREPGVPNHASLAILTWGVLGVVAVLGSAIVRLLPIALEPLRDGSLGAMHAVAYVASIVVMGYSEGYRAFHRQYSPRVVARGLALAGSKNWAFVAAAPLFCMSLFHATKRRLLAAWIVLAMVVVLVILVKMLPQPWRGVIDAGVVVGLGIGTVSILWYFVGALRGSAPPVSADLPDEPAG